MKKILAATAAVALVLTLGACSSDNTDQGAGPTVTITEQAPEPTFEPGGPVASAAFVSVMRDQFPLETAGVSDSEIAALGQTTCGAINEYDGDIAALLNYLITPPDAMDPLFAAFVIGAAVPAFCPEYQDDVDAFTNSDGGFGSDA